MAKGPQQPPFSRHYIKAWRLHRDLTQEELGERIGRSHATVQRIENRLVAVTQPVLDDLALALRTSRGALLDRPPSKDD